MSKSFKEFFKVLISAHIYMSQDCNDILFGTVGQTGEFISSFGNSGKYQTEFQHNEMYAFHYFIFSYMIYGREHIPLDSMVSGDMGHFCSVW